MSAQSEPVQSGSNQADQDTSFRHSAELAHQLVRHLGVNAARKTCTENHWTGVLEAINQFHRTE